MGMVASVPDVEVEPTPAVRSRTSSVFSGSNSSTIRETVWRYVQNAPQSG